MKILTIIILNCFCSLFVASVSYLLLAQNTSMLNCGNITPSNSLDYITSIRSEIDIYEREFSILKSSYKKTSNKVVNSIPLKITILRNSDGLNGINIGDVKNAISNLNRVYAEAFLEFFIADDINYIDNDDLVEIKKGSEKYLTEENNIPNLINIYFSHKVLNDSNENICGYSNNTSRNDFIMIKNDCATNGSSFAHEIGHFFSLLHTHGADNTKTTELVDGSNCDTDGDGMCDTPADPELTNTNVNGFCSYIGIETDVNGDNYKPDTRNIMSYSRKDCRTFFSPKQLARMYAFYHIAKNYLSYDLFNANFTADVSQSCENSLTVNFKSNCENGTKWEWDINSDGIIDYTTKNPSHTFYSGMYDVTLKVSNKSQTIIKTYTNFINVGTQTTLLNEDFEDISLVSHHGWGIKDVSQNGYNWLFAKGETESENTGPSTKNSEKNNNNTYLYAEASGAKYGDVAELISPCIPVDYENSQLEFAYHMFGEHIGELHVDIKTENGYIIDVIEPLIGSQQNQQDDDFIIQDIDLSAYVNQTIKVRFRAIRGSSWTGDIAIDNIGFKTITTAISDIPVTIYPNPIYGDLLYVNTSNPKVLSRYSIYNLRGQIFESGTLTGQPINVGNLSSGMYLITIENKDFTMTKKIIK